MTIEQLLRSLYQWADSQSLILFLVIGLALPLIGIILAWIGKGGRTDADGRFIASALVGLAIMLVVLEIACLFIASSFFNKSPLDGNFALFFAPPLGLFFTLTGIRLIFPLNQLASFRSFLDLAALAVACLVVIWFFSKFRGWGIIFWGSIFKLIAILMIIVFFLKRLYHRAFGISDERRD